MPFLLAAAGWALIATLAGFVTGIPELRSFGAVAFVGLSGVAVLWDRYAQVSHGPAPLGEVFWGEVEIAPWPGENEERPV